MPVDVGEQAPDFELRDQHNQPVRLTDYRGKRHVAVVFYLMAFSRICDRELAGLRDDVGAYDNDDVALLAVSCDAPATHRRQAEQDGYRFPLLSDFWPHGEVAQRYGVFDERFGLARRATFLVDRDGVVRYRTVNGIADPRDPAPLKEAIAGLAG
ncbi:MAG: peroxiredoxin [Actinomycetota bacterium]